MSESREERLYRLGRQYAEARRRLENKGHLEPTNYSKPPILTNKYLAAMRKNIKKNQERIAKSDDPLEHLKLGKWKSNAYRSSQPHTAAAVGQGTVHAAERAAESAAKIEASVARFQNIIKQAAAREAAAKEAAKAVPNPGSKKGGRRLTRSKRRAASTRRKRV